MKLSIFLIFYQAKGLLFTNYQIRPKKIKKEPYGTGPGKSVQAKNHMGYSLVKNYM